MYFALRLNCFCVAPTEPIVNTGGGGGGGRRRKMGGAY